ncbi:MAG TPA: AI-2E family transporter, partial [Armatimonadaceae bacterium]|nr:AI-2E family transporter [Armatimonadaceae bacterium]
PRAGRAADAPPPPEGAGRRRRVLPVGPGGSAAEWLRAGFFFVLGGVLLLALAAFAWQVVRAVAGIAAPFVVGVVLALLLDPVVDRLQRQRGIPRAGAVALVFAVVLLVVALLAALIVPLLIDRIGYFTQHGPEYVRLLTGAINEYLRTHDRIGPIALPRSVDALAAQYSGAAEKYVRDSAGGALAWLTTQAGQALNTFVALLIAFYLMVDFDRLRARLLYLLPARARTPMARSVHDVRVIFAGFLGKLFLLCVLYGASLMTILLLLSLFHPALRQYALVLGFAGLLLYAVPYVGATSLVVGSFVLGWAAGGSPGFGAVCGGAALALNLLFDNVVYPRVVGGGVGLHPVLAIFALVLGGSVFGLPGMILAVPTAASIQRLLYLAFPKLTAPTPESFLRHTGVTPDEAAPVAEMPQGPVSSAEADLPRVETGPPLPGA